MQQERRPLQKSGKHSVRPIGKSLISSEIIPAIYRHMELERTRFSDCPHLWCINCGKTANKDDNEVMKRCSRCKIGTYCSSKCQKEDWSKHKPICEEVADVRAWAVYMIEEVATYPILENVVPAIKEVDETREVDAYQDILTRIEREDSKEELREQRSMQISYQLTDCAAFHFHRVGKLRAEELKQKYKLPCCKYFLRTELMLGIKRNLEPVEATLKELIGGTAKNCRQCGQGPCYYSFCLDEVVYGGNFPPGVFHCELCNRCGDYMCWHDTVCDHCFYGGRFRLPCSNCHVMGLSEEGLIFRPVNKRCLEEDVPCDCNMGKVWLHPMIDKNCRVGRHFKFDHPLPPYMRGEESCGIC